MSNNCKRKLCLLCHFYTGLPNDCQNLTVTLQNEVFEEQGSRQGIYHVTGLVNEKPLWISNKSGQAIWYIQEWDDWAIGPLENVGSTIRGLGTINGGDIFPFNIASDKWQYWDGQLWVDSAINDIIIRCTGKVY